MGSVVKATDNIFETAVLQRWYTDRRLAVEDHLVCVCYLLIDFAAFCRVVERISIHCIASSIEPVPNTISSLTVLP